MSGIRKMAEPNGQICEVDITDYIVQKAAQGNKATVQLSPAAIYNKGNIYISTKENPYYEDAQYHPQLILEYVGEESNYGELQKWYDVYKDMTQGEYSDETWEVFQDALKKAEQTLNDPGATQAEIDLAAAELLAAAEGGRKIFCVYGKNSSLIRNRYV